MQWIRENALRLAWVQALLAMTGSLYFSEIRHFPPCVLCWYQRIAMYPLGIILAWVMINRVRGWKTLVLPFSTIGMLIAAYHCLLYYKILPEAIAPCTAGVSCTTEFIEYFGFITIPLLSFFAFAVITVLVLVARLDGQPHDDGGGDLRALK
jgi:disulfide bond formation protein DsbB